MSSHLTFGTASKPITHIIDKPSSTTHPQALQLTPNHPLALHLHIHLTEAGRPGPLPPPQDPPTGPVHAAQAEASADVLAGLLSTVQQGHLMHMPSHTYVRVGRYSDAVKVNKHAYEFDVARAGQCLVPYLPEHNVNMLIWAARWVVVSSRRRVA